jgi:hypothetical protein
MKIEFVSTAQYGETVRFTLDTVKDKERVAVRWGATVTIDIPVEMFGEAWGNVSESDKLKIIKRGDLS